MRIPVISWFDTQTGLVSHDTVVPAEDGQRPLWSSLLGNKLPEIRVVRMKDENGEPLTPLPSRGNPTDAGLDFHAAEDFTLLPYSACSHLSKGTALDNAHRALVPTGIKVKIPPGTVLQIWDRSGLSAKHGLHRVAGVVDDTYTGQIFVALINLSNDTYVIKKGDRIAQGIITPVLLPQVVEVDDLENTERGEKGFGSSGK